jgi:hypothetical protein
VAILLAVRVKTERDLLELVGEPDRTRPRSRRWLPELPDYIGRRPTDACCLFLLRWKTGLEAHPARANRTA